MDQDITVIESEYDLQHFLENGYNSATTAHHSGAKAKPTDREQIGNRKERITN